METRKFVVGCVALIAGFALTSGNAWSQIPLDGHYVSGYIAGDVANGRVNDPGNALFPVWPSGLGQGKLIPLYQVAPGQATIIGIENVSELQGPDADLAHYVEVHVTVFDARSVEQIDFDLCLSPFAFGFVILQDDPVSASQAAECNAAGATRGDQCQVLSLKNGSISADTGYVTLAPRGGGLADCSTTDEDTSAPITAWTIFQDVGTGFFGTEIPTLTALVHTDTGIVSGGIGAVGLIPHTNNVIARYDVNPGVGSDTTLFVWLAGNADTEIAGSDPLIDERSGTAKVLLDCEDELEISATLSLPNEVNIVNVGLDLQQLSLCAQQDQFRGVLRFEMPDTGFLWTHITQEGEHFRLNFAGINLECNDFLMDPLGFFECGADIALEE